MLGLSQKNLMYLRTLIYLARLYECSVLITFVLELDVFFFFWHLHLETTPMSNRILTSQLVI